MAQQQGVFLTVTVADCLPIFIFDPVTVSVAVVHSGWRGSKLRITEKTVKALRTKYGAESKNLIAFIGPSAGVCCYEVGEEVANEFLGNFLERKQNSRPHLDLKNFNRNLLLESGVKESNIEVSDYCTICNPDLFHSYRRDKERSGRMMGVIGLATT